MLLNPFQKKMIPLAIALTIFSNAHAEDVVTTAIEGVVNAGVKVELIKEGFEGTEGPIGLPDGSAIFTETKANRITKVSPDNTVSTYLENTNGANGLAFNKAGELFAVQTLQPKVGIIAPVGKEKTLAENYEGKPFQRPNDLVLAKNGGIYFTDSGTRPTPENPNVAPSNPGVYYISPKGAIKKVASDIERSNGVQLSTDEKTLYVANTAGEYILSYKIGKDGSISGKKNFAKLKGWSQSDKDQTWSSGADGLAVDAKDRLYVASNSGIEVFDAKGKELGVIPLPNKPQNLAFAGKDKKTLFVVGRGAAYKIPLKAAGYAGRAK